MITVQQAHRDIKLVERYLKAGNPPIGIRGSQSLGAVTLAAEHLKVDRQTMIRRVGYPGKAGLYERKFGLVPQWSLYVEQRLDEPGELSTSEQSKAAEKDRHVFHLQEQIRGLKNSLKEAHRQALDEDAVRTLLGVLGEAPVNPPNWLIKPKIRKGTATQEVPMTVWADWHYGDVVKPAEVNNVNAYNMGIAEMRVRNLVENTLNLCKNHHSGHYPGAIVCLLGDFVSGGIHPELAKHDETPVIDQALRTRDLLVWALKRMADEFGHLFCPCSSGNHGRNTLKPETKEYVRKNFDWLIYQLLMREFAKDKRITFKIPDSNDNFFEVFGTKFMATHGDMLGARGGDGIIGAIGPIMRGELKTSRQSSSFGAEYDYVIMGHWHQELWLPRAIVANALKGFDQFAHKVLRASPSRPSQPLWFVHPSKGITARWNVLVDQDKDKATEWLTWRTDQAAYLD